MFNEGLVSLMRQEVKKPAEKMNINQMDTRVGCPVIASMGSTTVLPMVTEPTVSGFHYDEQYRNHRFIQKQGE